MKHRQTSSIPSVQYNFNIAHKTLKQNQTNKTKSIVYAVEVILLVYSVWIGKRDGELLYNIS